MPLKSVVGLHTVWAILHMNSYNSYFKTLKNYNSNGNREIKKAIGLMSKITTLHLHHTFL